jgi:hypothetical protein
MKSILNPEFRYTPAAKTDIRRTFARIRKQLAEQEAERQAKVEPLRKSATGR